MRRFERNCFSAGQISHFGYSSFDHDNQRKVKSRGRGLASPSDMMSQANIQVLSSQGSIVSPKGSEKPPDGTGVDQVKSQQSLKKKRTQKQTDDEKIRETLDQIWAIYDQDGNNFLDRKESTNFVVAYMKAMGEDEMDPKGFEQMYQQVDADGSGYIQKAEIFDFLK